MSATIMPASGAIRNYLSHLSPRVASRNICRQHRLPVQGISRQYHATSPLALPSRIGPPKSRDRGPVSEEDTQTDFAALDVFNNTPAPTTGIDACASDGFSLNSGLKIVGSGVMLVGGDAFNWKPWTKKEGAVGGSAFGGGGSVLNAKGQWEVGAQSWGVLDLVWPKPDLLILGTGPSIIPVSQETRKQISDLGIRLEVSDTRNAAAQFNLLATERGVQQVAAALIPIGWREAR